MRAFAAGLALAAALGWGFVPTVIRLYASGGSLTGAVDPWSVASASLVLNVALFALVLLVVRRPSDADR